MQILSWLAPWRAQVTFVRPALLDGHAAAGLPAEADHRAPERLDAHGPDRAPLCPGGIDNRLHGYTDSSRVAQTRSGQSNRGACGSSDGRFGLPGSFPPAFL